MTLTGQQPSPAASAASTKAESAMPAPGGHAITRNLRVVTAFPLARSVTVQSGASGKYPQLVAQTGQNGWAEADLKSVMVDGRPEPDGPGDIPGPVGVMAAVSWTPTNAPAANTARQDATRREQFISAEYPRPCATRKARGGGACRRDATDWRRANIRSRTPGIMSGIHRACA